MFFFFLGLSFPPCDAPLYKKKSKGDYQIILA